MRYADNLCSRRSALNFEVVNALTGDYDRFDFSNLNLCHGKGGGAGSETVNNSTSPPPQVLAAYQTAMNAAQSAASQPLQQYGGPTIAGFTPDQTSAFNTIDQSQGIQNPYNTAAANDINAGTANLWNGVQQFSPSAISQYSSPYTQQVLNSTMAAENNQDAQQQTALQGNAISSGAWGGDRAGVASAILSGQQDIANNQTNANIENQGYNTALGEFNTQQQSQLGANEANSYLNEQAGFGLGSLGTNAQSEALTGANAQEASGAIQQQLGQAALNVPYEQFEQAQAYPFQTAQYFSNIAEGIGSESGGVGTSATTTPAPSTASQIAGFGLGGLGIAGAALSNRGGRVGAFGTGGRARRLATGGIPGDIPDLSVDFIPNTQPALGHGPPQAQSSSAKIQQPAQGGGLSASDLAGAGKGIKSLLGLFDSGQGALSADQIGAASVFDPAATELEGVSNVLDPYTLAGTADDGVGLGLDASLFGDAGGDAAAIGGLGDLGFSAADTAGLGDAALALLEFKRGGSAGALGTQRRHYDVGGATPAQASQQGQQMPTVNSQLNNLTPAQLQQYLMRLPIGSQQAQTVQSILQQKRMMPNVGAQATGGLGTQQQSSQQQPQAGQQQSLQTAAPGVMARGGMAGRGYDDGGMVDNGIYIPNPPPDSGPTDGQPVSGMNVQRVPLSDLAPPGTTPKGGPGPSVAAAIPRDAYAGAMGTQQQPARSSAAAPDPATDQAAPQRSPNPWLALAQAGFAMAGGTSPYAAVNISRGAEVGLNNYAAQQKQADDVNDAANKLMQEAKQHRDQIAIDQQNADTNTGYKNVLAQQALHGKYDVKTDAMGNLVKINTSTGEAERVPGTGLAVDPSTQGLTGQPYLDAIAKTDPAMAAQVKAMDEGDLNLPTGFAAKAPYWQQRLNALYQYNPAASQQTAAAVKAFNTGPQGNQTRYLNVATSHLGTLNNMVDALGNGDVKAFNQLGQAYATQTGSEAPTDFNTVKNIVGNEVTKAVVGAGGTGEDRDKAQQVINNSNSPEQLKGAISSYLQLMNGQLGGLRQQYTASTRRNDFDEKYLTPAARQAISSQQINDAGGSSQSGGNGAAAPNGVTPDMLRQEAIRRGLLPGGQQ